MISTAFTDSVTVKRLTQSSDKSSYSSVAGTLYGLFVPVDQDQNIVALRIVGQAYKFTTEGDNDIRPSDILTFNGEEYGVKGVQRFNQRSLDFLNVYLEKRQKYS